jgi:hypothetical protein
MSGIAGSLNKNKIFNILHNRDNLLIIVFITITLLILIILSNAASGYDSYIVSAPVGPNSGDINIDYEYKIYSSEVGSCWMFDWGDGTFSNWIEVGESDTYISQTHSWESYDEYEIRVKYRSAYLVESEWSPPLVVTIAISSDIDGDGWENDFEESYGTDPEDSEDYPLDTDGDDVPDGDSLDGLHTGDLDDDNDGLSDELES